MKKGLSLCRVRADSLLWGRAGACAVAIGLSLGVSPAAAFRIDHFQMPAALEMPTPQFSGPLVPIACGLSSTARLPVRATATASKTAAILGGAMSSLEALRAKQRGGAVLADAAPAPIVDVDSAAPVDGCAGRSSGNAPVVASRGTLPAPIDQPGRAIFQGRPDVFGSVALAVGRTPLDSKWQSVRNGKVASRSGPWAAKIAQIRNLDRAARVAEVNRWVNARIAFTDDAKLYRTADMWSGAAQTLGRGRGDCEDYAIAKMQLLEAAGVESADMFLVIARDLVRRADHAVLVVRDGDRLLVLDNGTDRLLESSEVRDYRPIFSYNAKGAWIHGYNHKPPVDRDAPSTPVELAMAR